ncbi:MAG: C1 family peptidase, partial [Chloroflexi bacterium]|nr:C1 family peptidase [Chloroflexota bacterium]
PEHQFSPSWIYNQRNTRDCRVDGGMSLYNGLSIIKTKGAATWATFPYQKNDPCVQPPQAAYDEAWQYRSESFANVFQGAGSANIDELKAILAGGMPIAMAVPVYYPSFYTVSDADPLVRRPGATETMLGGHALLIVGYDDAIGGFKFVNSWGTGYGLNGFAYLAYDFVRYEVWEAWVMTDYVEELVEVEVPLQAGWNLISLPVIPASEDPEILFGGIQDALGEVYTWDAVNSRWQRYMPSVPPYVNTLTQVTAAQGLWIKMDEEALLSVRGRPRHGQSIDLVPGWNLVAYPGNVPLPISDALAGIADQVALVHGYDPEQATWNVCRLGTSGGNSLTEMVPGGAYWLQVTAPCTWQLD